MFRVDDFGVESVGFILRLRDGVVRRGRRRVGRDQWTCGPASTASCPAHCEDASAKTWYGAAL